MSVLPDSPTLEKAVDAADDAVRAASPYVAVAGRAGLAVRGLLYLLVASISGMAAAGSGRSRPTGLGGAMRLLLHKPLGWTMVGAAAVGFACLAAWQLLMVLRPPRCHPNTFRRRCASRAACLGRAIASLGTAAIAANLLVAGHAGSDDDARARDWTRWLMGYPLGQLLVAGVGVAFLATGVGQTVVAWRSRLSVQLAPEEVPAGLRKPILAVSRFGIAARGVIFGILGVFLVSAAYYHDPGEARSLGGAVRWLQRQPAGAVLFWLATAGFAAFGVYCIASALYHRPPANTPGRS